MSASAKVKKAPWERVEYIRGDRTAFCWHCKEYHPAEAGKRLYCPKFGFLGSRMVARKS